MKKVTLSDQLTIHTFNRTEARVLFHEIFTTGAYLKHGIGLKQNDLVFDIGANIGMFTLFINKYFPGTKIIAFEPVLPIFTVLQRNVSDCIHNDQVRTFNIGISNKNQSVVFQFNKHLSMTAGMYTNELEKSVQKKATLIQWIHALLVDHAVSNPNSRPFTSWLIKGMKQPILKNIIAYSLFIPVLLYLLVMKSTTKKIRCQLQTLSDFISLNNISEIALCKIDVEGSESDVLSGIADEHWNHFKQFIIEVHDLNSRVDAIKELLTSKGFSVIIDQEDWELHKLMNIYTVFAFRNKVLSLDRSEFQNVYEQDHT